MHKIIVVTGATSGFGEATAMRFAKEGHKLIITGRRADRLEKLKLKIEKEFHTQVIILNFDVRDQVAVKKAVASLPDEWRKIDVLVNNAGLASGLDPIQSGDTEDWEKMIDTNVKGLLYVSKEIMPLMVARKNGHIINIGSTAGKEVYANGNVYCASKYAVDAITKGMRIDLLPHGIKVTQIAPGAANTEFATVRFHGDKEKANAVYNGYQPMSAQDIAELIYYSTTLPAHLCINDLVVTSLAQANSFYFHKA
ncbi:MAG: SDR family NAD(P)-dependent oxidoreductase [Crocinitomicaceae bacterium]|nr:SDR family NAD(P)-dependent oxidoreductase [Crocinitomicaceae bacterium]MBK8925373.1 SDR family NAD(P)-dependent oxidoreductase [Crocinitomicaceae bacterium]